MSRRYPRKERPLSEDLKRALVFLPPWVAPVLAVVAFLGIGFVVPAVLQMNAQPWRLLGAVVAVMTLVVGVEALVERGQRKRRLARTRSLDDLRAMTWSDFETLVEDAFRRQAWQTDRRGGRGADGGVDILLRRDGVVKAVQCKKWSVDVIRVQHVRELQGALEDHGAASGIFITAGTFTRDAEEFAARRGMELIDGEGLLALLGDIRSGAPLPTALRPEAGEREAACPRCGSGMLEKANRTTGQRFLGCSRFPACRGTRQLERV